MAGAGRSQVGATLRSFSNGSWDLGASWPYVPASGRRSARVAWFGAHIEHGAALTPALKDRHRLPVYPLVARGDDAAPLCRRPAVPGGDEAACGLDEGDERDDIVGLEAGLHDQIDAARRQQAIAVAITAIARHEHPRFEGVELGNFLRRGEEVGVGRGENRVGKPDTSTRAD